MAEESGSPEIADTINEVIASKRPPEDNKAVYLRYRPLDVGVEPLGDRCLLALIPIRIERLNFQQGDKGSLRRPFIGKDKATVVREWMAARVRAACEGGARVICCTEYSYPILEDVYLRKELTDLSRKHECYIVAGSYVEMNKMKPAYNTALLFAPRRANPYEIYKLTAGLTGLEPIASPPREVQIFCGLPWNFAVIICADVFDGNIRESVEIHNNLISRYKPIDLVVVPARDRNSKKVEDDSCRLSGQGKTCVVVPIDLEVGQRCKVFECGDDCSGKLERVKTPPYEAECGPIYTYSFDWVALRRRRFKEQKETMGEVEFQEL